MSDKHLLLSRVWGKLDWILFFTVYIAALIFAIHNYPLEFEGDRILEYQSYLNVVNGDGDFNRGLVDSSLFGVWLPAKFYLLTGIYIFDAIPFAIYPLMPAFVYAISRKYLNVYGALISSGLVLSSFFFAYGSGVGKAGIGWGLLGGFVWAILYNKKTPTVVFAILLALGHYASAFFALFVCGLSFLCLSASRLLGLNGIRKDLMSMVTGVAVLAVSVFIWYGYIASSTGTVVDVFVKKGLVVEEQPVAEPIPEPVAKPVVEPIVEPVVEPFFAPSGYWSLEIRDVVIKAVLGMTWKDMNIPQKIELISSVLVSILLSYGLYYMVRRRIMTGYHMWMSFASFGTILLTIIVPFFSLFGVIRVYFTTMIVLAPCYFAGASDVGRRLHTGRYVLPTLLLAVYGLCVSGIMHSWFGIVK